MHGLSKINDYDQMVLTFHHPLGIGSEISLILAISGNVFCPVIMMLLFIWRYH